MRRRRVRWMGMRGGVVAAVMAAAGAAVGGSRAGAGVDVRQPGGGAAGVVEEITGRTFGGVAIGAGVQEGAMVFRSSQAAAWSEGEGLGATRRLLLTGDVLVELGVYRFSAARAVVWLEQIGVAEEDPSIPVYQVAVYFDRVGDPGAEAGISQVGDRLLVTGILAGEVTLRTDVMRPGRPEGEPLLAEGEARLARLLADVLGARAVAAGGEDLTPRVGEEPGAPIRPGVSRPYEPETGVDVGSPTAKGTAVARAPAGEPIFAEDGVLTLAGGDVTLVGGGEGEEAALIRTGGVVVQYVNARTGQTLEITAERAVVFLPPERVADLAAQFSPDEVRGLYLEGNVVATGTDPEHGRYTLRGPRMYYDMRSNKAVVVDAVFWTYDERLGLPLYVRAKALRQESSDQFAAQDVRLSTSEFFDPHFAIGASSITVTRRARGGGGGAAASAGGDGETRTIVDGRNLTLRAGGVPLLYWPSFKGDVEQVPLRGVAVENSSNSGFALRTTWDPFGLLGIEEPDWLDMEVYLDGYFERGAALGTDLDWRNADSRGGLFAYTLINDHGEDVLTPGTEVERDGETRAIVTGEHLWRINERWTLQLEGAHISDETFVDAFFRGWAQNRREFTNAAYLKRLEGNTAFTLLAQGTMQDFTPNQYLLQSQGYTVDKAPEAGYFRVADDVFAGAWPGLVNWSQEYRVGLVRANFVEPTAAELGLLSPVLSERALGIAPDESPADALRARGFPENYVARFDARHEVTMKADFGPLRVSPFVVGRFTAYDTGFEAFNGGDDEKHRIFGAAGVRASTSLQKVDDTVDSRWLDLHRIRHIIEPSVTVWTAGANLHQEDLPVYDAEVESLATGSAVRAGITQTWQTKRGGPGRWRSVDFLVLRTDVVFSSGDAERESPVPRFFDYRPEYSLLGDFAEADLRWQVTDALGLTFNTIYDFDIDQPARTVVGATLEHTPDFRTWVELRYLNALDITYLDVGAEARLTRKYAAAGYATYDTDAGDFRSYGGVIRRRYPSLTLGVSFNFDNLTDDFSVGVVLEPIGLAQQPVRLERLQR